MRHPICPLCGLTHHPDEAASIDCQVETIDRIAILQRNLNRWRKLCEQTELELRKLEAEAAELRKMVPSVAPVQADAFAGCDHTRRIPLRLSGGTARAAIMIAVRSDLSRSGCGTW